MSQQTTADGITKTNKHKFKTSEKKKKLAANLVKAAKLQLLTQQPFYYIIALNMQVKFCNIGTCGTDGKYLYVDPQFLCGADEEYLQHQKAIYDVMEEVGALSKEKADEARAGLDVWFSPKTTEEVSVIIAHEIRHVLDDTIGRNAGKIMDHELLNKASDYCINNRLIWDLCKGDKERFFNGDSSGLFKGYPIMKKALHSDKYYSVECGTFKSWQTEEVYLDLMENQGKGEGGGSSFDVHMDMTEEQKQRMKEVIIQAARNLGARGVGNIPSDIQMQVDEWTTPKIKWNTFLERTMKSHIIHDYDYSKPAPRTLALTKVLRKKGLLSHNRHVVIPSNTTQDTLELMLVFDSSGSIYGSNNTLSKVLGESSGIVKQFPNAKLHVCCFDTKVHNYQVFDNANIDDLRNYKIVGGGGSSVNCVGELIKEKGLDLNSMVVFTDLYIECDWDLFRHIRNNVWVVFDNEANAPIGQTIHYSEFDDMV